MNINHFMSEGASPTARRTIIPRTAHARLDIRVTPDTPPAAMEEIVTRAVADHRDRTPGITFTVRFASQPASYTSPQRPEFGWLLRLLEQHGDAEAVALPTLGGTLPLWVFTETLGHSRAVDPRRQQRQPAARRQRALRAAPLLLTRPPSTRTSWARGRSDGSIRDRSATPGRRRSGWRSGGASRDPSPGRSAAAGNCRRPSPSGAPPRAAARGRSPCRAPGRRPS